MNERQVQVDDQSTLPSKHLSFVASGRCIEPDAPAVCTSSNMDALDFKMKWRAVVVSFGTGVDARKKPSFGAL